MIFDFLVVKIKIDVLSPIPKGNMRSYFVDFFSFPLRFRFCDFIFHFLFVDFFFKLFISNVFLEPRVTSFMVIFHKIMVVRPFYALSLSFRGYG